MTTSSVLLAHIVHMLGSSSMLCSYALCTVAVHGRPLTFNQLRNTQSPFQFPGPGVMLLMFSRPALVPRVEVPSAFIFAAKGRNSSMRLNTTSDEDDEVMGLATTVFNNIEKFLPDTLIDEPTQERVR